jgi:hypothetical protein
MERRDPPRRPRKGTISRVRFDGAVTLYGVEDWTELRDDPTFLTVPYQSDAAERDGSGAGDDEKQG